MWVMHVCMMMGRRRNVNGEGWDLGERSEGES